MARRESNFQAIIADSQVLSSRELRVGSRRTLQLHSHPGSILGERVVQRPVGPMQVDRGAGGLMHGLHSQDMVDMRVSEPDGPKRPLPAVQLGQETAGLLARID